MPQEQTIGGVADAVGGADVDERRPAHSAHRTGSQGCAHGRRTVRTQAVSILCAVAHEDLARKLVRIFDSVFQLS